MGASESQPTIRVTFTDFFPDPEDDDCLRRAVTVHSDRVTLEDEQMVLWLAGVEVQRYTLAIISAVNYNEAAAALQRTDPAAPRTQYPNAYQAWSIEDDERLLTMYHEGTRDFEVLGMELGRQPSAIRSRLEKLGFDRL